MLDSDIAPKFRSFVPADKLPEWTVATVTGLRKPKKKELVSGIEPITRRISLDTVDPFDYFTTAWINLNEKVCSVIESHPRYKSVGDEVNAIGLEFRFKFYCSGSRTVVIGIKLTSEGL